VTLPDTAVIDMGDPGDAMRSFVEVVLRGDPYWWLGMSRCTACQTAWLVAQEERQNDVYILRRLTRAESNSVVNANRWPNYLDLYATLLRLGRAAGHSAQFVDPVGDSSLAWTMADIARAEPDIALSELAKLLNLDYETAEIIAEQARLKDGVRITFDRESWQ
jgi:hypothetical protein